METLVPTQKKAGIRQLGKAITLILRKFGNFIRRKFCPANCVGRFHGKSF